LTQRDINHRLTLSYDGSSFLGWQIQKDKPSVQLRIEQALQQIWNRRIPVAGSGRTDAGVHALGQVANFFATPKFTRMDSLMAALNYHLPPAIRVLNACRVPDSFHARFSAKGKEYRYRIVNERFCSPFEINRAWHVPRPLDIESMKEAAKLFIGAHDFAAFASNPGYERESSIRSIFSIAFVRRGGAWNLVFRGNGFLYRMVRNIVGALVKVGHGRLSAGDIQRILDSRSRSQAPMTAPACGLYLARVFYTNFYAKACRSHLSRKSRPTHERRNLHGT
jgi:tRNA pseudouridine38-40 synthase